MTATTMPTIHLNGTSREELNKGYMAAYYALKAAIDALAETGPNGRDYYPQGDRAIGEAIDQHRARMMRLAGVMEEIEALALHTMD